VGGGDLDLDGGVATGVEDLSGVNLGDGHSEKGWVGVGLGVGGVGKGGKEE
jgi:hypothetical protein